MKFFNLNGSRSRQWKCLLTLATATNDQLETAALTRLIFALKLDPLSNKANTISSVILLPTNLEPFHWLDIITRNGWPASAMTQTISDSCREFNRARRRRSLRYDKSLRTKMRRSRAWIVHSVSDGDRRCQYPLWLTKTAIPHTHTPLIAAAAGLVCLP